MTASDSSKPQPLSSSPSSPTSGDAPTWLTITAKGGYAARAVIYLIIGSLTLLVVFGQSGEKTGAKGALTQILEAPFGIFLLWLMAAGLVGYSIWRGIQAVLDADNHGKKPKGLAIRAGLLVSAITHLILAFYAGSIAMRQSGSGGGDSSKESWVAQMLGWPAGKYIVGFIGLCIMGAGVAHAVKAHKEKYREVFDVGARKMKTLNPICKFGLYARGLAFLIIGGMFLAAAIFQNPEKAGGLKDVISTLSGQAYGGVLLTFMGGGLLAFGVYSAIESAYRKIDAPN